MPGELEEKNYLKYNSFTLLLLLLLLLLLISTDNTKFAKHSCSAGNLLSIQVGMLSLPISLGAVFFFFFLCVCVCVCVCVQT